MTTISVIDAKYINDYKLEILFSDNTTKMIDFEQFIKENPHQQWNIYLDKKHFKKFKIRNGNLVWGNNWDLVFPVHNLYNGSIANFE